jgi:hypothetical protein
MVLKDTNFFMEMDKTPGLKEFDCKNKHHVLWLQKIGGCVENLQLDGGAGAAAGLRLSNLLKNNPMGLTMPLEAFINIHAGMSIKYSGNVLNGSAWIPPKD